MLLVFFLESSSMAASIPIQTGIVKNSRVQMMLFWIALKKILSWKSSIKFFSPIKLMFGDNPFQSVKEYANVITPGSNIILTLISSAGAIRK